ncbi:uroporphyrinogen-III synthase [Luteimicrobium subarcticum]|uniref:Uroporphyrinogen-III synthase n=1 Tax=Luteimicrobium subarcticum TaxID=620910 RepID=A0A2M8WRV2_9MICO|nr:uroporphyrinogen-III synthase [Luteimicrobium subarcticum]PJI93675.1 uroporphyrinogen-III synthase [Luteimicrobium subarcticum]
MTTRGPRSAGDTSTGDTGTAGTGDTGTGGPLAGRTVLVPRALDRALGLAARLHELGAQVLVSAVVERAPAEDVDAIDSAARDLVAGRFTWTLVTSVNAIDELGAAVTRAGGALVDVPTRWAAVGPATAKALGAVGVEPELVPAESSAIGLLAALRALSVASATDRAGSGAETGDDTSATAPGPEVLLPLGDLARPTLARGLAAMGARQHVVTVYRTVTHPIDADVAAAWHDGRVDAVVLTSGSVAREISGQLGARDDVAGVAIGEPTRRAATEAGLRLDAVAATPDDAGLAAAVVVALTLHPSPEENA